MIGPEEYEKLTLEERRQIEDAVKELQEELKEVVERMPRWRMETRNKIKELNRQATRLAIGHLLSKLRQDYADLPHVLDYFNALEKDVIEHSEEFQPQEETPPNILGMPTSSQPNFQRYEVNLLVDNSKTQGAPVVSENHPSYQNLMGRAEHESRMGTLFTQFTLIKPGALHRANGGYLVLDALEAAPAAVRLGRPETRAQRQGVAYRVARGIAESDQHGDARAGADPAGCESHPGRRPDALLHALPVRPGFCRAVQSGGGFRRTDGPQSRELPALCALHRHHGATGRSTGRSISTPWRG